MTTYCVECDNPTRPCPDHPTSRRYLDPILYVPSIEGHRVVWRVPDSERERWDNPIKGTNPQTIDFQPIQHLVVQLEGWIFLSDTLEAQVRVAYDKNPRRTSRLVEKVIAGAKDQTLDKPDAYLAKHLK